MNLRPLPSGRPGAPPGLVRRAALAALPSRWPRARSASTSRPADFKPAQGTPPPPAPTALEKVDLAPGSGRVAKTGDSVEVQYTGTLLDGTKFDSSYDHGGKPFKFTLGKGEVRSRWDDGVVGMKPGGKLRKLRIPSDLAYGPSG